MATPVDSGEGVGPDDAVLTAWLDGALDAGERAALDRRLAAEPVLRARLEYLRRGDRAFGPAFDVLLAEAPSERMRAQFDSMLKQRTAGVPVAASSRSRWWMAAAAVTVFAVGGLAGYLLQLYLNPPAGYPGWRQVVAEYHALISPETVALFNEDPAELSRELAVMGGKLSLDLSPQSLALPDAVLKRAQLYDYRGVPLVQLIYDTASDGPVALCIIVNDRDNTELSFEQREGSNIVYWYKNGRGYLLIAKDASREQLEAYAGDIAARFS